ncbi:ribbon-helix-helix protein, CopG family [Clavibacter michiganensis]|uniref:ribbon-helix-helix protein, CopG family n=1 Tax=Clavibacter michiganensis TaxID=28447 RepID=UPI001BE0B4FE|nr:ribbon-helix-helix protein, CopG family [Clavibacter michiganensis]
MSPHMAKSQLDAPPSTSTGIVRLNVNLNAETAQALRDIAAARHISVTEAVRRAIAVYDYIEEETRSGRRVQTSDKNRENVRELVMMG